jgi:hypothetical protein
MTAATGAAGNNNFVAVAKSNLDGDASAATNFASFPTGFPGFFRIVFEIAPTGLASCTASFTRPFWIVGKIAGTTSVFLLCHRKTSYQCSIR